MKKLDKKQIPQFAALCVLTSGLFGYVVLHLVAPGPVSAGTRPAAAPTPAAGTKIGDAKIGDTKAGGAASTTGGAASTTDAAGTVNAPPPSPAMHDPFAVGYVDPKTAPAPPAAIQMPAAPALPKLAAASGPSILPVGFPGAPALPGGLSSFPVRPAGIAVGLPAAPAAPALPAAPAAPLWTVTGVLQGADGDVAVLRSGDARRFVRSGDFVDSTFRVTAVTRTSVMLRHGAAFYQLPLGGAKAAPAKPAFPAAPMPLPTPRPAAISSMVTPLLRPEPAAPVKVASAISLGLRLLDGTVAKQNYSGR